jgi:hypothetical protein
MYSQKAWPKKSHSRISPKVKEKCLHFMSKNGEEVSCVWGLVEKPEKRDHLLDIGVDGRIILKSIFKMWDGGMDWIDLAQVRDRGGLW